MGSVEGPIRYQGVDKASAGFKLLAAMGWKEGEGLVSPVRYIIRLDSDYIFQKNSLISWTPLL
jgi:hypothetical protein